MDELKLESKLMRSMISKIMGKVLRKKLGYNIDIQINDAITATMTEGKVHVHLNIDAEMSTDEFLKFTKIIDSES